MNAASVADFTTPLAGIFEHSPWVAARAATARPFESREQLLAALCAVVAGAAEDEQLALIRAHPTLGSRTRRVALTVASAQEQRRAGLDDCTVQDFVRLDQLNAEYLQKFAMPFILAVRGHDPASILRNFTARMDNDVAAERRAALEQIGLIAGHRLADLVAR